MATDNKHYRRLTHKTSNVDDYTIEFPLELTQQDYLRRIFNHCGGAFLQMSISIHKTIQEQNAADQELAVAAAFADANQHDDGEIATTSPLDDEVGAPDDEIEEENEPIVNSSPRSEVTSITPLFTPQAVRKCLSDILDDGAPGTPAPWKALKGNKKSKAYKAKEKKRQQKVQKELVKQQKHQAKLK